MNIQRLTDSIKAHEGYREKIYKCSAGYYTVGWGHNIHEIDLAKVTFITLGELLCWIESPAMHQAWLITDINWAIDETEDWLGRQTFLGLSSEQREVVAEMCFQLGRTRLSKFVKFLDAMQAGDFQTARLEMLNSLWSQQTPTRANTLADKFYR